MNKIITTTASKLKKILSVGYNNLKEKILHYNDIVNRKLTHSTV